MSKYLTFTTLIEPAYSVYMPPSKWAALAYHQDALGVVWAEWPSGGPHNNAYVRVGRSALEIAQVDMQLRESLEARP